MSVFREQFPNKPAFPNYLKIRPGSDGSLFITHFGDLDPSITRPMDQRQTYARLYEDWLGSLSLAGSWLPHNVHLTEHPRGAAILEFNTSGVEVINEDRFVKPGFLLRIGREAVETIDRFNQECGADGRYFLPVVERFRQVISRGPVGS